MENVLSLKMLGVLALVLLASGGNEGRIVSKCELKAQLEAAFGANMTGNMIPGTPADITGNMTLNSTGNMIQGTPANVTGNMTQNFPRNVTGNPTQNVPRNGTGNTTGDLIARLVCVVERTSRFNTSLISTIQLPPQNISKPDGPHQKPGEKPNGGRPGDSSEERPGDNNGGRPGDNNGGRPGNSNGGRPGDSNGGRPGDSNGGRPGNSNGGRPGNSNGGRPGNSNGGRPGGKQGDSNGNKPRGKRSPRRGPGGGHIRPPTGISGVSSGIPMNLYGIFQLNDQVACDSGSNQSLNICGMNCNAFIDDDISDDIACLKTLWGDLSNAMTDTFVEECRSVVASQEFALCV